MKFQKKKKKVHSLKIHFRIEKLFLVYNPVALFKMINHVKRTLEINLL